MMLRRVTLLGLLCVLLPPRVATSTVVIPPSFDDLVARAQSVFVGQVIDRQSIWESTAQGRSIVTQVTFKVEDVWKGSVGPVTRLEFLGGTIGEVTLEVNGVPVFTVGQRDVLFVTGDVRTISPLVGLSYGRLRIERDTVGGIDRVRLFDGRSIGSLAEIGRPRSSSFTPVTPMRLAEVAEAVRARAHNGRQP
jgi:hypothetical protein